MSLRRLLAVSIAVAALAACLGAALYCLGLAVYALFLPWLGPAGAAAALAGCMAVVLALAAAVASLALRPRVRRPKAGEPPQGAVLDRVLGFVADHPVVSVCTAAGVVAAAALRPRFAVAALAAFASRRLRAVD